MNEGRAQWAGTEENRDALEAGHVGSFTGIQMGPQPLSPTTARLGELAQASARRRASAARAKISLVDIWNS